MTRILTLILCLASLSANAANWYINPAAVSSGNGTDWSQAFSGFGALGAGWPNVNPGDTIWVAKGPIAGANIPKGGTIGARISILRATVASHGTSVGWNNAMDGQVTGTVPYAQGNAMFRVDNHDYITIDGITPSGFKITVAVPTIDTSNQQAAAVYGIIATGNSNIFGNMEFVTPGFTPNNNIGIQAGDNFHYGHKTGLWIHHVWVHGLTGSIQPGDTDNILVEQCDLGVTPGNFFNHDNCAYIYGLADHGVFRNNYIHDWGAIAVTFNAQSPPGPDDWVVAGNVFWNHGTGQCLQTDASGTGAPWQLRGNWLIANNTFANNLYSFRNDSRWPNVFSSATTGGAITNNIMWASGAFTPGAMSHDYDYTDASSLFGEPHGVTSVPFPPFVNYAAGDFHIVGNVGGSFPRNSGVSVSPSIVSPDKDQVSRVGLWSRGAYEFGSPGVTAGDVSFSQATAAVTETGGTLAVTVNRGNGNSGFVTVTATTSNGTALSGHDYTATTTTLTWADGTQGARSFTVPILNSGDTASTNRTFTITLSAATGGVTIGNPNTQTVTIIMNRPAGTVQWSATGYSMSETSGSVTLTATRTGGSAGVLVANYATSNGSAVAGHDYTSASGQLTWADGDSANKTVSVPILNSGDTSATPRLFAVNLSGTGIGSPSSATVTIAMNPPLPVGSIQWTAAVFNTTEASPSVTLTAQRFGGSSGAVSVNYNTANGSALSGHDYTAASGTLSWANGDTANKTVTVSLINSGDVSLNPRTFQVNLSAPTGGAGLGLSSATISIAMDSPGPLPVPGQVGFTQTSYSTTETSGTVTISVTRAGGSNAAVSVTVSTANGTAVSGFDYTATAGTLSWGANENSTKSFNVTILNSGSFGPPRFFTINMLPSSGNPNLLPSQTAVSIAMTVPIGITTQVTLGGAVIGGSTTIGGK